MVRLRIKYEKVGAIRFASHRDTIRLFRRGLAVADVPVCYSQGFNPHPRLSFGPSLRTGWEGLGECMDVLLERPFSDFGTSCNAGLPEGLRIVETTEVETSVPKLSADVKAARYTVFLDHRNSVAGISQTARTGAARKPGGPVIGTAGGDPVRRPELEAAIRKHILNEGRAGEQADHSELLELNIIEGTGGIEIEYMSSMNQGKSIFPEALLEPLCGDTGALEIPLKIVRKGLYVERDGSFISPVSKGAVQGKP